jgi:hypothetical protein
MPHLVSWSEAHGRPRHRNPSQNATGFGPVLCDVPPLTDAERVRVHELLAALSEARAVRVAAHRERLEQVAHRLGRRVAAHEVTRRAAALRLDALAMACDPECPVPLLLIPYRDALDLARAAFAAGFTKVD